MVTRSRVIYSKQSQEIVNNVLEYFKKLEIEEKSSCQPTCMIPMQHMEAATGVGHTTIFTGQFRQRNVGKGWLLMKTYCIKSHIHFQVSPSTSEEDQAFLPQFTL